jgi:O-antigen/teichoic acid export membrane protein
MSGDLRSVEAASIDDGEEPADRTAERRVRKSRGIFSAGIAMISRASNQLFLIGVTLVATRYLDPADFGVFALATAFVTLARTLLYAGPFEYLIKSREFVADAVECLAATVLLAGLCAIFLVGIALVSPFVFSSAAVRPVMLMLMPSTLLAALAAWMESQVLRSGRVQTYYLITLGVELASSVIAVVLLLLHFGLFALVVQNYARTILLTIAYRTIHRPAALHSIDMIRLREIIRWSISRYGSVLVAFLSNYSGDLVLGVVLSPSATGLYRASNRVVTAVSDVFAQPARLIGMTSLSRRAAQGLALDGYWLRILSGIALLGWPALIGLASLADWLTPIMLGGKWTAAGPVVAIIAIARLWSLVSAVTTAQMIAADRQKRVFWVQLAGATMVAVFTIVLSPLGVTGAATAAAMVLAATAAALLATTVAIARPSAIEWRSAGLVILVPTAATAAGAIAGRFLAATLTEHMVARLAISICTGALGWAVAVFVLRRQAIEAIHTLGGAGEVTQAAG